MTSYTITNRTSGMDLGTYEAETREAAILAMTKDAGYASREEMAEALSTTVEALDADVVVTEA